MIARHIILFVLSIIVLLTPAYAVEPLLVPLDVVDHEFSLDDLDQPSHPFPAAHLTYGEKSSHENGHTTTSGVIEIVPSHALGTVDDACSRWDVYSIEQKASTLLCHGPDSCCARLQLASNRATWNAPLYLSLGLHGTTTNNIVAHQVVRMSNGSVSYSRWTKKDVVFDDAVQPLAQSVSTSANELNVQFISETHTDPHSSQKTRFELKPVRNVLPASTQVFVTNTAPAELDWDNAAYVSVNTSNDELKTGLGQNGVVVESLVAVKQMGEVLSEDEYDGEVRLPLPAQMNRVLFCPDDTVASCISLNKCQQSQESCYEVLSGEVVVYVPHYSTIILGFDNDTALLSITSPDNVSSLVSGENVSVNLSANITVAVNVSVDGSTAVFLGNATSLVSSIGGDLGHGVFSNGEHTLDFGFTDQFGRHSSLKHTFVVADTSAPSATLNITNQSTLIVDVLSTTLLVSLSEYGNVSYAVNGGGVVTLGDAGSDKSVIITSPLIVGVNTLVVTVTDVQGNSVTEHYEFTVTQAGTCSDGTQNQDETGVDCGGVCAACIALSVLMDKSSYQLGDTSLLSVFARANSSVLVQVKRGGVRVWQHNFTPSFAGAPIADSRVVTNISTIGTYTVDALLLYLNATESSSTSFTVTAPPSPTLSVTLSMNATEIIKGRQVYLDAVYSGATGATSVFWDFNNDGVVDSTLDNLSRTFEENGTQIINLTVIDDDDTVTVTRTLDVLNQHTMTMYVRDNRTLRHIPNVTFDIDGKEYHSTPDAFDIVLAEGTYTVDGSHENYTDKRQEVTLKRNMIVYVNLTGFDREKPVLSLNDPAVNITLRNTTVDFFFTVTDESTITCTLFTRQDSVLWKAQQSSTISNPEGKYSMTLSGLEEGYHQWQIECRDVRGNLQISETESFTLNLDDPLIEINAESEEQRAEELMAQIEQALKDLNNVQSAEQEVAEAINLRKLLERSLTDLKRIKRDIGSLIWRRLNETTLPIEQENIRVRTEAIYQNTPTSLEVQDKREYVLYPTIEDLEPVVDYYVNQTNLKLSGRERERLIEDIHEAQSLVTVTTRATTVTFTLLDGSEKTQTVMHKKIDHTVAKPDDYVFYEVIPKKFAKLVNETTLLFDYTVIDPDPIIGIDIEKISEYSYILPSKHNPEDTQEILSVLLPKDISVTSAPLITGFAIIDDVTSGIADSVDLRLVIEFIIVLILLFIYLVYSVGSVQKLKLWFVHKSVREVHQLLDLVHQAVADRKYSDAKKHYTTALAHFKALEHHHKHKVQPHITQATHAVNVLYMHTLLNEADTVSAEQDKGKMKQVYKKVQSLYKILPGEHKKTVSQKCLMLHHSLTGKNHAH